MFENGNASNLLAKDAIFAEDTSLSVNRLNRDVKKVIERGLPKRGPGCYGNWAASTENAISAFVLVVFPVEDSELKNACYETLLPASFGVYPAVTTLDF